MPVKNIWIMQKRKTVRKSALFLQMKAISNTFRRWDILQNQGILLIKMERYWGTHQGILHYTIGQRKGLGVALGKPAFVTDIDCSRNEIVLGDNEDLFENEVISRDNCFVSGTLEDYNGKHGPCKSTLLCTTIRSGHSRRRRPNPYCFFTEAEGNHARTIHCFL